MRTSGGLRERLFNAAYNAKKQAMLSGNELHQKELCHIVAWEISFAFSLIYYISKIHCLSLNAEGP